MEDQRAELRRRRAGDGIVAAEADLLGRAALEALSGRGRDRHPLRQRDDRFLQRRRRDPLDVPVCGVEL